MLAMVGVPAGLTLATVRAPGTLQLPTADPTPHGYTVSLLLFIVPILVITTWFLARGDLRLPRRAVGWTLGVLVPIGFGLDFFLANRFFVFRNPGATLGLGAPALGGLVPVEEYVFYLTGFAAVLLIYVWLDEYWLAAYNVPDYPARAARIPRLVRFHVESVAAAAALVALAVAYKKLVSDSPEGFPGYICFLAAVAFVPSAGLFASARPFVNWPAFSLTLFLVVLISLVWEATLAIPYGWWGYQPRQMMGLRVEAWAGLPIEAVFVWIAVTYATVIVYEILKLWRASGKAAGQAFFGRP
jgi:lycopene cyclase domain-containing protein